MTAKPKKRRGAPRTIPTQEIIEKVCNLIAIECQGITNIGKQDGLPSKDILFKWLREADKLRAGLVKPVADDTPGREEELEYRAGVIEFLNGYERACEARADARAEKIHETIEKVRLGKMEPHAARVIIDGHKWLAGKEKPNKYSDKHQIEHTGKDGGPIETSNKSLALAIIGVLQEGGGDVKQLLESPQETLEAEPQKQLGHSLYKGVETKE